MDENLKRKVNESDDEYQIRLTLLKQSGMDIDWSEIAELVGDGRSSESYRKDSYGIRRFNNIKTSISDNETLIEIKKQKIQLTDLKTNVNAKIRDLARTENVIDLMKNEIKELSNSKSFFNDYENISVGQNDMILCLGDWHYGIEIIRNCNEL